MTIALAPLLRRVFPVFLREVTNSKEVTLRLGAQQRQPLLFRLSTSKQELHPNGGTAEARRITLRPFEK